MQDSYEPQVFTRNKLRLHALLIEQQAWFCARDVGRLMGRYLEGGATRKLDDDQQRSVRLRYYGRFEEVLMISESAIYALLVYHHHPANHQLRRWLTYQVMPPLLASPSLREDGPTPARLEWQGGELSVLHWQNEPWIRLKDMPSLQPAREALQLRAGNWWRKACRALPFIG